MGRPAWCKDDRFASLASRIVHAETLDERIADWTRDRVDYDVMSALQEAGIAAGAVQNTEDMLERDPQLRERSFFERIEHFKKGTVIASGIPLGLTGTPGWTRHAGEAIGQDNEYVFREVVGISAEDYAQYVAAGAIESIDD